MSRHRRQASQVLPPELIVGNDEALKPSDHMGQATAAGHGGASSTVTGKSKDSHTATHQDASVSTHCPAIPKKPPAVKPASACKAEDQCWIHEICTLKLLSTVFFLLLNVWLCFSSFVLLFQCHLLFKMASFFFFIPAFVEFPFSLYMYKNKLRKCERN